MSVFASGGDVYVVGYEQDGSTIPHAALWKNNLPAQRLSNATSRAHGVYVLGGDTYVAGFEWSADGTTPYAKLWKNGAIQQMGGSDEYSAGLSVFVR